MTAKRLILTIVIAGCALFANIGCEEVTAPVQRLDPRWFDQFPAPEQLQTAQAPAPQEIRHASPKITFDKVVHDFGDVGPLTDSLCEFRFTNTGDAPLKIEQVEKTCGCTPFVLEKTEYAPGESGSLKVKYYSDTQLGLTTKNLTVRSNDRENPEVTLAIKARVASVVEYEPKTLSLLLKQENAGCPNITLTSTDGKPFSISYVRSTDNCVALDYDPSAKATSFVLEPRVNMAQLERTLRGSIEIGLTHPECKAVTVSLDTLPKFRVAPIVARATGEGSPVVKNVRITSNYDESFAFESATSEKGTAKVLSTQAIPKGYELEVELTPPADTKGRVVADKLFLRTTSGDQLEIPCTVFLPGATASQISALRKDKNCPTCGPRLVGSSGVVIGPPQD